MGLFAKNSMDQLVRRINPIYAQHQEVHQDLLRGRFTIMTRHSSGI